MSVPGRAEQPEPEPRVRRPRRRLPRVRRAAGARRAAPHANRAAATSARRARRPTARRCATTTHFSYVAAWEFKGVGQRADAAQGAAGVRGRASRRSGATSRGCELEIDRMTASDTAEVWRQAGPRRDGPARRLHRRERVARHVVPRDARRRQRGADQQGRGSDRVRLGLPRRHLRHLRLRGQRRRRTGPIRGTTVCQLHMRRFKDGDTITLEPWRAQGVPGGQGPGRRPQRVRPDHPGRRLHVGERRRRAGRQRHPDPEGRRRAAMDSAACIGCGACVAACKNASAALFTSRQDHATSACCRRARSSASARVVAMVERHDAEGFGSCSNEGECEAVCPKEISITNIARMNREYLKAMLRLADGRRAGRGRRRTLTSLATRRSAIASDLDHVDEFLDGAGRLLQRRLLFRPSA